MATGYNEALVQSSFFALAQSDKMLPKLDVSKCGGRTACHINDGHYEVWKMGFTSTLTLGDSGQVRVALKVQHRFNFGSWLSSSRMPWWGVEWRFSAAASSDCSGIGYGCGKTLAQKRFSFWSDNKKKEDIRRHLTWIFAINIFIIIIILMKWYEFVLCKQLGSHYENFSSHF